ncbi:conserved hypothetical protein [Theileria equi strain WA]|uniref:Uncharacterized protein n=1 Tax=Theileria equi strain WA TaxID=1537102 RepID=L1LE47_THEEQ|nr:conserved hypothetical protein [Theileria equi strain WA]EKX73559.1 conserved hypothetical protein [Theileria equi strain WA]|eukprot:XP_004833011.1 conserved hypothetical protein [Theileria equi strain WA]
MDINVCVKRYYRADLLSCLTTSLILFFAVIFGDYSRGVDRLTKQITYLLLVLVPAKVFIHTFVIPNYTFSTHKNGNNILRRGRSEKFRLMRNSCIYLFFLALILTTNNNPLHILNYVFVTIVFTTVTFGTVVHFIYLEKGDFTDSKNAEEKDKATKKFYSSFVIYVLLLALGVSFGNFLVLLDWYQVYAQFPITSYIGLSVGHILASVASNLLYL